MSSYKAKRMTAEAVRAEACARLRKMKTEPGDSDKAAGYIGGTVAGWVLQWTNGHAAIMVPADDRKGRRELPESWRGLMALDDDTQPAVAWRPHAGIARAVHVLQAVARGSKTLWATVCPEVCDVATETGRVVLRYEDPIVAHTARTWADAAVSVAVPDDDGPDHALLGAVIEQSASRVALPYLAAVLWADEGEWSIQRTTGGPIPALLFTSPEVRIIIAEVGQ